MTAAWLPVVDNLELALAHADESSPVVDGVRAVRDQAVTAGALGYPARRRDRRALRPGAARGGPRGVGRREPGTVVEVLRPGYGEGEQQLRPAAVVVAGEQEA